MKTNEYVQKNSGKAKSLHDVVTDPLLSKEPIKVEKEICEEDSEPQDNNVAVKKEQWEDSDVNVRRQRIKDKLSASKFNEGPTGSGKIKENSDSEDDLLLTHEEEKKQQSEKKRCVCMYYSHK